MLRRTENCQILHFCMEHFPQRRLSLFTLQNIMWFPTSLQGNDILSIVENELKIIFSGDRLSIFKYYFYYSAMVACTLMSAPMMFVSAQLLTITTINPNEYISLLDNFLLNISVLALFATFFTSFVFLVSKNWRQMPHCQTLALVITQG